ncbi:hypothetical protein V9T40_003208 [Parthenolecanium corni]|uniref:Uncharacterized protein n=1 Tax=Parthenolecanium corni TaxID=536013 RepID=A0AAN9U0U4_9HEMI
MAAKLALPLVARWRPDGTPSFPPVSFRLLHDESTTALGSMAHRINHMVLGKEALPRGHRVEVADSCSRKFLSANKMPNSWILWNSCVSALSQMPIFRFSRTNKAKCWSLWLYNVIKRDDMLYQNNIICIVAERLISRPFVGVMLPCVQLHGEKYEIRKSTLQVK